MNTSSEPGRPGRTVPDHEHPAAPARAGDDAVEPPERTMEDVAWGRLERRRERIRAQVRRNREGGHRVPTWVLAVILAVFLAGWVYLLATR
ncbi:hypothetical protein [Mangrovihabitans endophyticus]|uniref:Uncharacterized protein n=1 Tax=Mangrovihabitans endophyticus TaxID=1751298 RepID=A0A8J3FQ30_9ACTN|nr:hypothetical protein [Mangrovihabitans endophyticus]GGL03996.1 hypothetical protein GCM10012284_43290 [Mangrovihabitans endophyticus]